MRQKNKGTSPFRRALPPGLQLLCALAVMAAAILVRMPSSLFRGEPEARREAWTAESGTPYLTDMDSYYHARLVRNYLENGRLGNAVREDGTEWDTLRYAPEGSSAEYQPGIVWLTAAVCRLFGSSPESTEYVLAAAAASLSALAAYLIGRRLGGTAGGAAAGLLTGCAPVYVMRTCFGRFDTDVFTVIMGLLLILFLTEALRAAAWGRRAAYIAGFALAAAVSSLFWVPEFVMLFIGLTLLGGALAVPVRMLSEGRGLRGFFRRPEPVVVLCCAVLSAAGLLAACGPAVFSRVPELLSVYTSSGGGREALPNLFTSISELSRTAFFPARADQLFSGYVSGSSPAAVNGTGGLAAFLLCLAGLICLVLCCFPRLRARLRPEEHGESAVYACVLCVWLIACCLLIQRGVRFIEHLSIPVGLLAAAFIGQTAHWIRRAEKGRESGAGGVRLTPGRAARALLPWLLCAAAVIPAAAGAVQSAAASRPSVSDASANAMRYIRENAKDPDAVVASWWDPGYFYESESGHPCLWDGGNPTGTENGTRAILISRALITDDPELSRRILLMLSGSGDAAVNMLREHTDARTAFETLWQALPLERDEAAAVLAEKAGLTAEEARKAEALLHPAQPRETYLIITYTMTQQMGWYEYYSGWDFTGTQAPPETTLYSYTPSGTPLFNTESGQAYLDSVRSRETMWQLFFAAVRTPCFTPAYEWHDGLEHVRVWRVEPVQQTV